MQKRILLVDDNEDLLLITQVILKSQGYAVELAKTIREAETAMAGGLPALILMDVNLCGEDGAAYCRELKEAPASKGIRIVLMSGDDDLPGLAGSGADDFLAKPFDFSELVGKVSVQLAEFTQPVAMGKE
ncbi:MAG TPA: response regulator [Chitinophagaceae bacterium]